MKNPYTILDVDQDAKKKEINEAQMLAMKKKKYSLQEIQVAAKQLLKPSKRLAADFMFPTKFKVKRIKKINSDLAYEEIDLEKINKDAFNSLK
jgi:hypothetical protein